MCPQATVSAVKAFDGQNGASVNATTSNIQISEVWNYTNNGSRSTKPIGYQFSQSITVKVRAVPPTSNVTSQLISEVLDAAVTAGGNNLTISSVSADLSPALRAQVQSQAQQQAVAAAQNTANVLATASGVKLGALVVLSTSDSTPVPVPYATAAPEAMRDSAAKASTPIDVGTTTVSSSVSATYAIAA